MDASAVYLIEEGVVKVFRYEGVRRTVIGLRFPGWLLGGTATITRRRLVVAAETATKCRLRRIDARAFRCLLEADQQLVLDSLRLCAEELEDLMAQSGVGRLLARRRLERLLYALAPACGTIAHSGLRLSLPVRHFELAEAIMVSPQYLSQLLKGLESDGLIRRQGGRLFLLDPDQLWHGDLSPRLSSMPLSDHALSQSGTDAARDLPRGR
jgi:CRP-like cAMP-binding protein